MNKPLYLLILICIYFITPICGICGEYVLPAPDSLENVSPPSVTDILKKVTDKALKVSQDGEKEILNVIYTKETLIFTEAGGIVFPERLITGGPVKIWYTPKTIKENLKSPIAAVVIVPRRRTN